MPSRQGRAPPRHAASRSWYRSAPCARSMTPETCWYAGTCRRWSAIRPCRPTTWCAATPSGRRSPGLPLPGNNRQHVAAAARAPASRTGRRPPGRPARPGIPAQRRRQRQEDRKGHRGGGDGQRCWRRDQLAQAMVGEKDLLGTGESRGCRPVRREEQAPVPAEFLGRPVDPAVPLTPVARELVRYQSPAVRVVHVPAVVSRPHAGGLTAPSPLCSTKPPIRRPDPARCAGSGTWSPW